MFRQFLGQLGAERCRQFLRRGRPELLAGWVGQLAGSGSGNFALRNLETTSIEIMSTRPTNSTSALFGARGNAAAGSGGAPLARANQDGAVREDRDRARQQVPSFLRNTSCHFQWNCVPYDLELGHLEEILRRLEKIAEEPGPYLRPRLEAKLARGYLLFARKGELDESVALISEVEKFCRAPTASGTSHSLLSAELREKSWDERRKGLQHVAGSALANIVWRSRSSLVGSQLPFLADKEAGNYPSLEDLGVEARAAVSACRAFTLSMFGADKVVDAVAQYEKAIKMHPDCYLYYLNLGITLYRYGRETNDTKMLQKQLKAFQKAVELSSAAGWNDPLPHAFLGETLRKQAKVHHSRMRNALGYDDESLTEKGTVRELNDRAGSAFQESLSMMKKNGESHESVKALELIGHALGTMPNPVRDFNTSLATLERALALDPDNPRVCHRIGALHEFANGDLKTAVAFYRSAKKLLRTDNSAILYDFIRAKSWLDKDYDPLVDFSQLIWRNREETLVKAFCWRGLYFLKVKNDPRSCLEDWLHALKLDPAGKEMKYIPDGPSWCLSGAAADLNNNLASAEKARKQETVRDYVAELQNIVHDLCTSVSINADDESSSASWAVELLVRRAWVESLVGSKKVASSLYERAYEVLTRQKDALGQQEVLFQWMWTELDQGKTKNALERLHQIKYPTMLAKMCDPCRPPSTIPFQSPSSHSSSSQHSGNQHQGGLLKRASPDPVLTHAAQTRNAASTLLSLAGSLCEHCDPIRRTIAAIALIAKDTSPSVIDERQETSCKQMLGLSPVHNCEAEAMLKTLCRLRFEMCKAAATGQSVEDRGLAVKAVLEEAKKCRDRAFNTFIDEFYPYAKGRHYYPIVFNNSPPSDDRPQLYDMPRCDDAYWDSAPHGSREKARGILLRYKLKKLNHVERKHAAVVDFLTDNNPMMTRKLWFLDLIERMVNEDKHSREMSLTADEVDQLFPVAHLSAAFSEKVMEFFVHYTRENGGQGSNTGLGSLFNPDDYDSLL